MNRVKYYCGNELALEQVYDFEHEDIEKVIVRCMVSRGFVRAMESITTSSMLGGKLAARYTLISNDVHIEWMNDAYGPQRDVSKERRDKMRAWMLAESRRADNGKD